MKKNSLLNLFKSLTLQYQLSILFIFLILAISMPIGIYGFKNTFDAYIEDAIDIGDSDVKNLSNGIENILFEVPDDLEFLVGYYGFERYLDWVSVQDSKEVTKWKKIVQDTFRSYIGSKHKYYTVSVLDMHGNETIKVAYNLLKKEALSITKDQLRFQGNEDYFKNALAMNKGQIYTSNIVYEKNLFSSEDQYLPLIHFSIPVYNSRNEKFGVIHLSLLANEIQKQISNLNSKNTHQKIMLIGNNGNYLIDENNNVTANADTLNKNNFLNDYPNDFQSIKEKYQGSFITDISIVSYIRVGFQQIVSEKKWILVSITDKNIALKHFNQFRNIFILIILAVLFLSFFIARYFMKTIVQPLSIATDQLQNLSLGKVDTTEIKYGFDDEVGKIIESINALKINTNNLIEYANTIAYGNYTAQLKIRSDEDTLIQSLNGMKEELKSHTDELKQEKEFTQTLIDSQDQIIITTDGNTLQTANETFNDFFAVDDVAEFMQAYDAKCICDTFNTNAPKDYLQINMGRESWIDYVISRPYNTTHKAMITVRDSDFIFSVTAAKLPGDEGLKSAVFTDITEMEKAQKELFLEEEKFRSLTEGSLDSIMRFDREYRHLYSNPATTQLTGIPHELFLDKTHEEMGFPLELCKTFDDAIEVVFQTKESHRIMIDLLNGVWIDWMLVPEKNGDEVTAVVTTARDITLQKKNELEIENAKTEIEAIHKHTRDSIEYAALIQGALIPDANVFRNYFSDYFTIWHPKDLVGGDIYLYEELRGGNESLMMVIDCTGHGVPGAFVTMLVKAIERQVIAKIENDRNIDVSPSWILSYFNRTMKKLLQQESKESISNAGFDGGIIYYNKKENIIKFSGAETALFCIEDEELKTIKGNRHSVGYKKSDVSYEFKEHVIPVKEGMKFYLTTDGYLDQNGGEKSFPMGKKRFANLIVENQNETFADQKEMLLHSLENYQGDEERNDDVTVIGFEIKKQETLKTILEYNGVLTQGIIAHSMDVLENSIEDMNAIGKISTIVIELTQNMMHYSKSKELNSKEMVPAGLIEVTQDSESRYYVKSENIVSIEDKTRMETKLTEIQSLDALEVKKRYRELRKSGAHSHEKGGGIGFYEIAKLTQEFEYSFTEVNAEKYIYEFKAIVMPK